MGIYRHDYRGRPTQKKQAHGRPHGAAAAGGTFLDHTRLRSGHHVLRLPQASSRSPAHPALITRKSTPHFSLVHGYHDAAEPDREHGVALHSMPSDGVHVG